MCQVILSIFTVDLIINIKVDLTPLGPETLEIGLQGVIHIKVTTKITTNELITYIISHVKVNFNKKRKLLTKIYQ